MFTSFDYEMMRRALALAARGRYTTQPNPRVGCVIVKNESVVGEGWHRKSGEAHAEPLALAAAGVDAEGSTVYVTLEPHSHQSRTPPCTDALIRAKVKRVICATLDPNPQVFGNGVTLMKAAGIDVSNGLLEVEARALNAGFEKRMRTGTPRVTLKIAASLDGRIALANGKSQWITGEAARADVQHLRAATGAILTGIETVLADDPQLDVRDASIETLGRQPLRAVLDSQLRFPANARMLRSSGEIVLFTTRNVGAPRFERDDVQVQEVAQDATGRLDLHAVLRELGLRGCNDVLIESGPTLAGRLIELALCDELILYLAPKVLGPDARSMMQLPMLDRLDNAPLFKLCNHEQIGDDLKLTYLPVARS